MKDLKVKRTRWTSGSGLYDQFYAYWKDEKGNDRRQKIGTIFKDEVTYKRSYVLDVEELDKLLNEYSSLEEIERTFKLVKNVLTS